MSPQPFAAFTPFPAATPLRAAITAGYARDEAECVSALAPLAEQGAEDAARTAAIAAGLVEGLRANASRGGVEGLIHEYSLSSQEGVALMCLAEALLRIPDAATRDALIRDKIASGDWRSHVGHSRSLFVNAATWGLVVTGKLTSTTSETTLGSALTRLIARSGEPIIRKGVDLAMRMMGEQFVTGQTIDEALENGRAMVARGFRYSYDMLGEAAMTAEDAARYTAEYEGAIHAIGKAAAGRGIYEGPGVSIKLSALHPRYVRAKAARVMGELLPVLKRLAVLAKGYDIGFNIDAEEADRLELSLDLIEALALDPDLKGWNGIGLALQAYGKRCPDVVDWLVDLGRRSHRRLMVRLVKGAYWDMEIKRAQVEGLEGYPVFTRKVHTDISYLACARKLLAAPDAIFPQFATHNAQTLAAIMTMAGPNFYRGQYEFQCLHGMGEALYEQVVGEETFGRPCRIYAPVGAHETLLAYLVRRLLENGANSSFVNRIADEAVPVAELVMDPVTAARQSGAFGAPHARIAAPADILGPSRRNSRGLNLASDETLRDLIAGMAASAETRWTAPAGGGTGAPVRNPADHRDIVGHARDTTPQEISAAVTRAVAAADGWAATPPEARAAVLARAAHAMEAQTAVLIGLLVREAGKSVANALAEVREAVDFLRYYGAEAKRTLGAGRTPALGAVVCISPWNFPLAIFTGQAAAALAAGNTVLAKPAEETPLVAAEAVRLLHQAGAPAEVVQFVAGAGEVGAALVGDARVQGVIFTGSTQVARLIQKQLSQRLSPEGRPIPLIAETGGQNALVVDSSALVEQVVGDVIASAFDSAGQRCSALRILCVQEDIAERTLAMLKGALDELEIGATTALSADIGPVITAEARDGIEAHVAAMRARGHKVWRQALPAATAQGTFVAPTIIEIDRISDVEREVFGPVLHVLRFRRDDLDGVIDAINGTGYGLTFGLHTRIDETIARVVDRAEAGNIYVNRNIIGAIVGVQPFGGLGLSGTGPKAGGPLYLGRLVKAPPANALRPAQRPSGGRGAAGAFVHWLGAAGHHAAAERGHGYLARSPLGAHVDLPGPVGERNVYALRPRGRIAALADSAEAGLSQIAAILATGNTAVVESSGPAAALLAGAPAEARAKIAVVDDWQAEAHLRAVLYAGDEAGLRKVLATLAARDGAIVLAHALGAEGFARGDDYDVNALVEECAISTNTAAAGGNASLMSI